MPSYYAYRMTGTPDPVFSDSNRVIEVVEGSCCGTSSVLQTVTA